MGRRIWVHGRFESCIYCGMEQETILYYYPMPEQTAITENRYAAKRRWFQEASLKTDVIVRQAEFQILGCAIPPFYYRHRRWKPQILSGLMETVLGDAAGMADTWIHPGMGAMLTEEYCARWAPREDTVQMLVRYLMGKYAGKILEDCGMVTVLLGRPADMDRQMEMTWELLQPFLPKVNRMLIYYEKQTAERQKLESRETEWGEEKHGEAGDEEPSARDRSTYSLSGRKRRGQEDRRESPEPEEDVALNQYLEEYYYEYGLVVQLEPYVKTHVAGGDTAASTILQQSVPVVLRCGKAKCGGIILDYCEQFRYPKMLTESSIYIDTVSAGEKDRLIGRKSLPITYLSPFKYLDTMVKNSYDSKRPSGG